MKLITFNADTYNNNDPQKQIMIMMIHTPSNTVFENRKQAIKCMGRYNYLNELNKSNFVFINKKK